ncbi:DUF5655 domain-containing protein [Chitinimonas viridis]|uniref:DUF5655 domain-containing protein n=1 Tax=Chitinimonas viridis TaxID=664880 RepID=A0ABT8B045_9NEIS|nr:DUF5655 domain-containing protein [Chitinimonas viridis]MDN3575618.1 DUF5655 domain-containing protein [Chitinimonas viridis]
MMSDTAKALATQLANIEQRSGKRLDELVALVRQSSLKKHGELRDMLQRELGLGYGDANTLVHHALQSDGGSAAAAQGLSGDEVLDGLYSGPKAALRPIHDKLMAALASFGEFETAPKKTCVSLRRKKQFAMVGPATKTCVEVGINHKSLSPTERLQALPAGGMCQYKVRLSQPEEVDEALLGWLRQAYDSAS